MCSFNQVSQFHLKGLCESLADKIDINYVVNYKKNMETKNDVFIFEGQRGSNIIFNTSINRWTITSMESGRPLMVQMSQVRINHKIFSKILISICQRRLPTGPQDWRMEAGSCGRARQNGDHSDHRSWKVLIFDGKFYLNFTGFCLHFDGKRVTKTNILLLTI